MHYIASVIKAKKDILLGVKSFVSFVHFLRVFAISSILFFEVGSLLVISRDGAIVGMGL